MKDCQFGECRQSTASILEAYGMGSVEEFIAAFGEALFYFLLSN